MRAAPSGTPRWAGSVRSAGAVQRTAENPGTLDWRAGGYLRLLERVCKVGGQTGARVRDKSQKQAGRQHGHCNLIAPLP